MRFRCKSCGIQFRIHRRYLRRGAIGIFLVWFIVTLGASYFPFSSYAKVALYIVTLFAAISIFNLFIPFEEVEQEEEQKNNL